MFINTVDEYDTGITGFPCHVDNLVEKIPGLNGILYLSGTRIDQVEIGICFNRFHEFFGYGNRQIKVRQGSHIFFSGDELFYIGMVYIQNRHICAATCSSLFNYVGRRVKGFHERNRSAGHAARGTDPVGFRSETGK